MFATNYTFTVHGDELIIFDTFKNGRITRPFPFFFPHSDATLLYLAPMPLFSIWLIHRYSSTLITYSLSLSQKSHHSPSHHGP